MDIVFFLLEPSYFTQYSFSIVWSICLNLLLCHFSNCVLFHFINMSHFFHSSVEVYLCCFQFLEIISRAAMNIAKQLFLWLGKVSFGYMPRVDIWLGLEVYKFPVFQRTIILISTVIVQVCPPTHNGGVFYLFQLSYVLLILAIHRGVKWNLKVVLIYIFLITENDNIDWKVS